MNDLNDWSFLFPLQTGHRTRLAGREPCPALKNDLLTSDSSGPLLGLRVLDFTRVLAGPFCTALLADLGADVMKVESPQGDDYRHVGPFVDGQSALFMFANRGKRSVVLDLKNSAELEVARHLAASTDVVVENFRPGVAE